MIMLEIYKWLVFPIFCVSLIILHKSYIILYFVWIASIQHSHTFWIKGMKGCLNWPKKPQCSDETLYLMSDWTF